MVIVLKFLIEVQLTYNVFVIAFNANCQIAHFILHLQEWLDFEQMDMVDATGRLVGLHQSSRSNNLVTKIERYIPSKSFTKGFC